MTKFRSLLILSIVLAACGGSSTAVVDSPVVITADQAAYHPGDVGHATMTNVSSSTLSPDLCIRSIERRDADLWTTVATSPPAGTACALVGITLTPGQSIVVAFDVPSTLGAGSGVYRLSFDQLRGPGGAALSADQRASTSFTLH